MNSTNPLWSILSIITILLAFPLYLSADTISYSYDNAGNRIKREIVLDTRANSDNRETAPINIEIDKKSITIYPNPTRGLIKIEIQDDDFIDQCNFSLFTLSGQFILSRKPDMPITDLDLSHMPDGIYLLIIQSNNHKESWKIIKKS